MVTSTRVLPKIPSWLGWPLIPVTYKYKLFSYSITWDKSIYSATCLYPNRLKAKTYFMQQFLKSWFLFCRTHTYFIPLNANRIYAKSACMQKQCELQCKFHSNLSVVGEFFVDLGDIPDTVPIGRYWTEGSSIPFILIGTKQKGIHDTLPIDQRDTPYYFPPHMTSSKVE